MLNTNAVFEAIEHLGSLKTKEKEAQAAKYLESELFERIIKLALDPFITYGIKKFDDKSIHGSVTRDNFEESDFETLELLASRQLTGNAAIAEVERIYYELHPSSATLFKRILKKDLRAGFSAKLINKVKPGTIFVFECMLSQKYEEKRIKEWPVDVEPKLDGVRVLAINKEGEGYRFFSRTGKEFHNFEHIAEVLNTLGDTSMVFDGEIVNQSGSFNETVGDVHKKGVQAVSAVYHVFDIIPQSDFERGSWGAMQTARKDLLAVYLGGLQGNNCVVGVEVVAANSNQEVMDLYHDIRSKGGEGVIVKPRDGFYMCKRSYNWLKIKDQVAVDVQVKGLEVGTGKYANVLGALIVDFNGVEVKVGSGLSDQDRKTFWDKPDDIINQMVEIEYHEITPDGSLRHPRFVRTREDKPVEDGVGV